MNGLERRERTIIAQGNHARLSTDVVWPWKVSASSACESRSRQTFYTAGKPLTSAARAPAAGRGGGALRLHPMQRIPRRLLSIPKRIARVGDGCRDRGAGRRLGPGLESGARRRTAADGDAGQRNYAHWPGRGPCSARRAEDKLGMDGRIYERLNAADTGRGPSEAAGQTGKEFEAQWEPGRIVRRAFEAVGLLSPDE